MVCKIICSSFGNALSPYVIMAKNSVLIAVYYWGKMIIAHHRFLTIAFKMISINCVSD